MIDRYAEKDIVTGDDTLDRGSFNFIVGLYDTDNNIMCLYKLDT